MPLALVDLVGQRRVSRAGEPAPLTLYGKAPYPQGPGRVGAGEDVGAGVAGEPGAGHAAEGSRRAAIVNHAEVGPRRVLLGRQDPIAAVGPVDQVGDHEPGDGPTVRVDDECGRLPDAPVRPGLGP